MAASMEPAIGRATRSRTPTTAASRARSASSWLRDRSNRSCIRRDSISISRKSGPIRGADVEKLGGDADRLGGQSGEPLLRLYPPFGQEDRVERPPHRCQDAKPLEIARGLSFLDRLLEEVLRSLQLSAERNGLLDEEPVLAARSGSARREVAGRIADHRIRPGARLPRPFARRVDARGRGRRRRAVLQRELFELGERDRLRSDCGWRLRHRRNSDERDRGEEGSRCSSRRCLPPLLRFQLLNPVEERLARGRERSSSCPWSRCSIRAAGRGFLASRPCRPWSSACPGDSRGTCRRSVRTETPAMAMRVACASGLFAMLRWVSAPMFTLRPNAGLAASASAWPS